jgi:hypothetical protein
MNNNTSLRLLTWGTAIAALAGAVLLSGGESGVPELVAHHHFDLGQSPRVESKAFSATRRNAPPAANTHSSGVH